MNDPVPVPVIVVMVTEPDDVISKAIELEIVNPTRETGPVVEVKNSPAPDWSIGTRTGEPTEVIKE
jgi:hypothetical protein